MAGRDCGSDWRKARTMVGPLEVHKWVKKGVSHKWPRPRCLGTCAVSSCQNAVCCMVSTAHSKRWLLTPGCIVYTMAKTDKINISHKTPLLCRPTKSYTIVIDKVQKSLTAYNASLAAFAKSCLAIFLSFNPKRAPLKFLWLYSKWSRALSQNIFLFSIH